MTTPAAHDSAYVDLHVHSTYSDGRFQPTEAVEAAARLGLAAIAVTDHDVTGGLAEAAEAGARLGVEVVPGVELTADWDGRTVHILGYFIAADAPPLVDALARARAEMAAHVREVLEAAREYGVVLDEQALSRYRTRYVGGASLVLGMLEQGVLRTSPHARKLLLRAAREPRSYTAAQAIQVIHAAGGLASLAHPVKIKRAEPLLSAADLATLLAAGLDGIECWQIVQRREARDHYLRLAAETGLLPTGGSDCHGPTERGLWLGTQRVPAWVLSALRERWLERGAPPARS